MKVKGNLDTKEEHFALRTKYTEMHTGWKAKHVKYVHLLLIRCQIIRIIHLLKINK